MEFDWESKREFNLVFFQTCTPSILYTNVHQDQVNHGKKKTQANLSIASAQVYCIENNDQCIGSIVERGAGKKQKERSETEGEKETERCQDKRRRS